MIFLRAQKIRKWFYDHCCFYAPLYSLSWKPAKDVNNTVNNLTDLHSFKIIIFSFPHL